MVFFLAASASATATGSVSLTMAAAGFEIEVVDRGLLAYISSPLMTYRRAPGGGQILNISDENTGLTRADIGLQESQDFLSGLYVLYADWEQFAVTFGSAWVFSLSSFDWSGHGSYLETSSDLETGRLFSDGRYRSSYVTIGGLPALIASYYAPPIDLSNIAVASDSNGALSRGVELYIHGPIEPTEDTWHDSYSGRLDLCDEEVVSSAYPLELLGFAEYHGPGSAIINITITSSFEHTFGVETQFSADITGSLKQALELHYGNSVTTNTSDTFAVNSSVSSEVSVPDGYVAKFYAAWVANATFPFEAHYGPTGYSHDDKIYDLRSPVLGRVITVTPVEEGGGGQG